jgi:hypothetical protein
VEALHRLIERAPNDPVLLAGAIVAAWLPICAAALLCLALLAALQNYLHNRPRGPRLLAVPPADLRPLVARRTISTGRQGNVVLDLTRLTLALGAVLGFTALILASAGSELLRAIGR